MSSTNKLMVLALAVLGGTAIFFFARQGERAPSQPIVRSLSGHRAPVPDATVHDSVAQVPRIAPGTNLTVIIAMLGPPDESSARSFGWHREAYSLSLELNERREVEFVIISVGPGRAALTMDGVVLGRDTLADVRQKLAAQLAPESEDFGMQDFTWYLTEELTSSPEHPYKRSYSWYLNEGVRDEKALLYADGDPTPSVFEKLAVRTYSLGGK